MKYIYEGYSNIGQRETNEDSYSIEYIDNKLLLVVCDGLGGHESGEEASQIAVQIIKKSLFDSFNIDEAIQNANRYIYQNNEKNEKKMLTTVCCAVIGTDKTIFAHVGDSRIYAFLNNKIIYQSTDHSVAQMSVFVGEIKSSQIRNHVDRNKLIRVLGAKDSVKIDIREINNSEYNSLLLCTDGFWEYVLEDNMIDTLKISQNPLEWQQKMRNVLEKNKSTKNDNNTAITLFRK